MDNNINTLFNKQHNKLNVNETYILSVNTERREKIRNNHSATPLHAL